MDYFSLLICHVPIDSIAYSTAHPVCHCYECRKSSETFITYSQSEMEITLKNDEADVTSHHYIHRTVVTRGLSLGNSLWYEFGTCFIDWCQWLVSSLMRNIFFEKTNNVYLRDRQNFSLQNVSIYIIINILTLLRSIFFAYKPNPDC